MQLPWLLPHCIHPVSTTPLFRGRYSFYDNQNWSHKWSFSFTGPIQSMELVTMRYSPFPICLFVQVNLENLPLQIFFQLSFNWCYTVVKKSTPLPPLPVHYLHPSASRLLCSPSPPSRAWLGEWCCRVLMCGCFLFVPAISVCVCVCVCVCVIRICEGFLS